MSKRSIKIDGITTSLYLEDAFWCEIETRAALEGLTNAQYLRAHLNSSDIEGNRSGAIKEFLMFQLRNEHERLKNQKYQNNNSRWLIEEHGKRRRLEFNIDNITVGSKEGNDIVLHDPQVEALHFLLVFDGSRWWSTDLNSKNGVTLNNKPAIVAKIPRRSELSVGNTQIIKI